MEPLSPRRRKVYLTLLVLVFIIFTPVLIFYSTGYRLDDALSIVKTGGIFVHSDISKTKVYLDNEFVEDVGVFFKNILIQDLKPNKEYEIRIEKDDYQTWQKILPVYPNIVTEAYAFLLPSKFEIKEIKEPINLEKSLQANFYQEDLYLYEKAYSLFYPATSTPTSTANIIDTLEDLSPTSTWPSFVFEQDLDDLIPIDSQVLFKDKIAYWLEDGVVRVVWGGREDSTPYYFCLNGDCRKEIIVSTDQPIRYFEVFPGRDEILIIASGSTIEAIEVDDRSERNIQYIYEGLEPTFRFDGNSLYILDDGKFYLTSF